MSQAMPDIEHQFRLLIESVRDYAIFMLDSQGNIASWNPGAQQIKGYSAGEVLGRHFSLFYAPEDINAGVPQQELDLAVRVGKFEAQGWRVRKDGNRFTAYIVITPIIDEKGELIGFAKVTRDISAQNAAEQRFRQVVESAPSAMVLTNSRGVIELVNTQVERLFGYSRLELLGASVETLLPLPLREHHPHLRDAFLTAPSARPMGKGRDLYARRKDGQEIPVEIGLNPIETEEGIKILSAIVDISDRKQKELKIQAALAEKNVLLGEIHHRVKNNLQIIHSLLDLQSNRISDPVALELLRDSQNRIRSMALIHQSLYQSNDFVEVNLGTVLDALIPTLVESYNVDHSRIRYELSATDVLLSINQAIPCGLIVNELIANALKHAFPGDREGVIQVLLEREGDEGIHLSVTDDGIGIPEDFDLNNTTTLGLQLVKILVEQLGATLQINCSSPTRFDISFKKVN